MELPKVSPCDVWCFSVSSPDVSQTAITLLPRISLLDALQGIYKAGGKISFRHSSSRRFR